MQTKVIKAYISFFVICTFSLNSFLSNAQVSMQNPSFEDEPADATTPMGWLPCAKYTTPDIFPGYWGVYNEATDGETFVGLITRDDGSHESISTRLSEDLIADECYNFSLDLAHSKTYSGYNGAIRLKIYISENKCGTDQLILETDFVKHPEWKSYPVRFTPTENMRYIHIRAFYKKGLHAHKGNILIDNLSPVVLCNRA